MPPPSTRDTVPTQANCGLQRFSTRDTNTKCHGYESSETRIKQHCHGVTGKTGGLAEETPISAANCIKCGAVLDTQDRGQTWLIDNGQAVHKGVCPHEG